MKKIYNILFISFIRKLKLSTKKKNNVPKTFLFMVDVVVNHVNGRKANCKQLGFKKTIQSRIGIEIPNIKIGFDYEIRFEKKQDKLKAPMRGSNKNK